MNKTFGGQLKSLRLERGLSQDELAAMLGTSKQVISRYETNQRVPKISTANLYAQILNIPLTFLLEGTSDPTNQIAPNPSNLSSTNLHELDSRLTDIIKIYNDINEEGREKLADYASDLEGNPRYKKETQFDVGSKEA